MKTINHIVLFAITLIVLVLSSCKQDSLIEGVSDLPTTEQTKQEVFLEASLIETADSIAIDTTTPSVQSRDLQLIYEANSSVQQGQWTLLYYNKGNLDPSYKYVVKITPYFGDPDLYIHGYNGSYRMIRSSGNGGTYIDQTYGRLSDLASNESRLYLSVYGYQASSYKIQIYKEYNCAVGCLQGRYTIETGVTTKYLDVQWGSNATGTPLHIWPYNGGAAQRWTLYSAGDGYYYLRSDVGTYLDVKGASAASTTPVWMYPFNGTIAQKWHPIPIGNGYYYLRSQLGTYLDVKGGATADGTPIWMYTFNGSNAQRWKLSGI